MNHALKPVTILIALVLVGCAIQDRTEVVREYIEEVVNTGNVDLLKRYISPDYVETLYPTGTCGLEGSRRHVLGVRETYPDLRLTIDRQMVDGDWVITRYTARGTHRGNWLGMKPTDFCASCNSQWGVHMFSLHRFCETGKGEPFPKS